MILNSIIIQAIPFLYILLSLQIGNEARKAEIWVCLEDIVQTSMPVSATPLNLWGERRQTSCHCKWLYLIFSFSIVLNLSSSVLTTVHWSTKVSTFLMLPLCLMVNICQLQKLIHCLTLFLLKVVFSVSPHAGKSCHWQCHSTI